MSPLNMDNLDNPHPANKTQPGNYPRPKCDPKKTIVRTTPAAVNPTMEPDPSVAYRGSRPHRPPAPIPNQPIKSPYPPQRAISTQHNGLTEPNSTSNTACPFISQPPLHHSTSRRTSRYPQHPHAQVRSVCSPAARMANPYALGVHRAAHTKN